MGRKIDSLAKSFDFNKDITDSLRHQLMIGNDIIKSLKEDSAKKEDVNSKILSEKNKIPNKTIINIITIQYPLFITLYRKIII